MRFGRPKAFKPIPGIAPAIKTASLSSDAQVSFADFVALTGARATGAQRIPLIGMAQAGSGGFFDDAGVRQNASIRILGEFHSGTIAPSTDAGVAEAMAASPAGKRYCSP